MNEALIHLNGDAHFNPNNSFYMEGSNTNKSQYAFYDILGRLGAPTPPSWASGVSGSGVYSESGGPGLELDNDYAQWALETWNRISHNGGPAQPASPPHPGVLSSVPRDNAQDPATGSETVQAGVYLSATSDGVIFASSSDAGSRGTLLPTATYLVVLPSASHRRHRRAVGVPRASWRVSMIYLRPERSSRYEAYPEASPLPLGSLGGPRIDRWLWFPRDERGDDPIRHVTRRE